jgi:hypothetical protein
MIWFSGAPSDQQYLQQVFINTQAMTLKITPARKITKRIR